MHDLSPLKAEDPVIYPVLKSSKTCGQLVLHIRREAAANESYTGGKGASLAQLYKISLEKSANFSVPEAVVVTTVAYKMLINLNPDIKTELELLENSI